MHGKYSKEWNTVLSRLKQRVSDDNFELWFSSMQFAGVDEKRKKLVVAAINSFMRDYLDDNFRDMIEREARPVFPGLTLEIIETKRTPANVFTSVPLEAPKPENGVIKRGRTAPNLRPGFTFDNFVVGSSNEMAYAACLRIAKNPGESYNPLFLHSPTGFGKTHLAQAVAHKTLELNRNANVVYVTAENFLNELVRAIHGGSVERFHDRYRNNCDCLIVDDLQFLAGKSSSQEEIFHLFNCLHDKGKQMLFTADEFPAEIRDLDERLVSRLKSGLVVDIKHPSHETLREILLRKAAAAKIPLAEPMAEHIVKNLPANTNIRELEGILMRLEALSSLMAKPAITAELANEALSRFVSAKKIISPDLIIRIVCLYFKIAPAALKGKSKMQKIVFPRQVAMYLLKRHTEMSLQEIGSFFGGRDHSTALHSINKIENLVIEDVKTQQQIDALRRRIEKETK